MAKAEGGVGAGPRGEDEEGEDGDEEEGGEENGDLGVELACGRVYSRSERCNMEEGDGKGAGK